MCIMLFISISLNLIFATGCGARHSIDGKYHTSITDFSLVIPKRLTADGEFESFHINQFFEHDFPPSGVRKRSLDDPGKIHVGVWLEDELQLLDLHPNRDFLNPNLIFERHDNRPVYKREAENLVGKKLCYYLGTVRGYDDSTASISTCNGLLGHIQLEDRDYFIEPAKDYEANEEGQHLHIIQNLNKKFDRKKRNVFGGSWCGVDDNESQWEEEIEERIRESLQLRKREYGIDNSTSLKPKFMETTMVCDKSMIEFHKGHRDLEIYMLTAANTAFDAFRDASFGSELTLSLVRVIYLDRDENEIDLNVTVSIDDTLTSFNKFAENINVPENDPWHHDVAMLASRVDMCNGPKQENCVVCGVAKIGGACKRESSAVVGEDDGVYELAMTLTHEAGHLLGITHDGAEGLGKPCRNSKVADNTTGRPKAWIMSVVDPNAEYLGWSECSRAMSKTFIKNGWADCMNDEPERTNKKFNHFPIGAIYNRDEQCYLATIRKGPQFESNKTCGDPSECAKLYCQYYGTNKGCKTLGHVVADGTSCGEEKWCWNSTCVATGQRPDAVDGGWSDWNGWSECSRSCGGGIQINKRTCDHPRQAHGGRYCQGDDQIIKLCNLEPCEEYLRDKVCRKEVKGTGLLLNKNPCQIACLNPKGKVQWTKQMVPDGEACTWGKKPKRRCLFGECVKIGCDDQIGSAAVTDDCGVCEGDGDTCTVTEGRWNRKRNNSTRIQDVVTFPVGAFNIKIREATASESKISIVDQDTKHVYINNYEGKNQNASLPGTIVLKDGITGYFSTDGLVENFTVEDRIKERLLFKVVYLNENADFKWRFSFVYGNETANKDERTYRWEQDGWTECNKICGGGIQTSTYSCTEDKLGKVSENLCKGLIDKPDPVIQSCKEQPCKYRWRIGNWGACQPCKKKGGAAARGVECMQENPEKGGEDILVDDSKCEDPKPSTLKLCQPTQPPSGVRKKRCTMGLPEKYMDSVWDQLDNL